MAAPTDLLKQKAILLLRREQELFQVGVARQRTSEWLRAFHSLALETEPHTPSLLFASWTNALIQGLGFQSAAVFKRVAPARLELVAGTSRAPLPPHLALDAIDALVAASYGVRNDPGSPEVEALAAEVGLQRFLWAAIADHLVVAGFVPDTAPYMAALSDDDLSYFDMLARHLFVLVRNCTLIGELQQSLASVQATRAELADKVLELQATREQLVQRGKLAVAGELAGAVAHEVNNPLSTVICGVEAVSEYVDTMDRLWRAAKRAGAYLQTSGDPVAREIARNLDVEGSEPETDATVGHVVAAIEDTRGGVRRLAELVTGFMRLADPCPPVSDVVDVGALIREVAPGAPVGAVLARVSADHLRTAIVGILAFLAGFERSGTTIHVDAAAGRPRIVVTDLEVTVSEVECRSLFDPRVRIDTRRGRTMRLDLDLAVAYQNLVLGGAEVSVARCGERGVIVQFLLHAAAA